MQKKVIEIGDLYGTMEVHGFEFTSYIARIYRVNSEQWWKTTFEESTLLAYKSFGNGVAAENWLLDCLEYPSFVYLLGK